jgi:hypothetical protein
MKKRTAAFEREIEDVTAAGYTVVSIERFQQYELDWSIDGEPEDEAVMERRVGDGPAAAVDTRRNERFKLLEPGSRKLQQQLDDYVPRGYRILVVQWEPLILLERSLEPNDQSTYLVVLPRRGDGTLQHDMNVAASRGFRLLPRSLFHAHEPGFFGSGGWGLIMEKRGDPGPQPEYLVIQTKRYSTLRKELADALLRGFEPVELYGPSIFLQRPMAR